MNICEHLTATARIYPDRDAIRFEGTSLTYAQLDALSLAAANQLAEQGIRAGDRVAMMLANVPAFAVWYYAALRIGAIAVSISTRSAASEVAYFVKDSGASLLVSDNTSRDDWKLPCPIVTTNDIGDCSSVVPTESHTSHGSHNSENHSGDHCATELDCSSAVSAESSLSKSSSAQEGSGILEDSSLNSENHSGDHCAAELECSSAVSAESSLSKTSSAQQGSGILEDSSLNSEIHSGDHCATDHCAADGRAAIYNAHPNDPAAILYTSGTTGFAKGATLSHMNVRSNVHAFNHLCNQRPDDVILLAVPLFHCFGQNALLNSALNVGATLVLQRKFDLNESKRLIAEHRVTQLYGVPMMFQLFLESCEPSDLASVNYCFSAAATLPIQVGQRWQQKFGIPIHEGYGLTETSPFASYNHRDRFVCGSIGTPIDCVEMKVVDPETGADCAVGELGEIVVRGPNVMLGYWNRDHETAAAIRDGWFHSGDIGRIDEQGFFYIVDRVKDMIAVGGLKVFPAEVERVLLDHAAVSQVAVVGIQDDVFGEQVVAFVVLDAKSSPAEERLNSIRQHAKQHLANYKVPRMVVPIEELPRNPSGKVLKRELREFDLRNLARNPPAADDDSEAAVTEHQLRSPTLRKQLEATHAAGRARAAVEFVQQLVKVIAYADELPNPTDGFLDAGMDSLMIVELSNQIQVELGSDHEIPATLVFDYPRICDLADYLVSVLFSSHFVGEVRPSHEPAEANLRNEIESLSEDEALSELIKELNS